MSGRWRRGESVGGQPSVGGGAVCPLPNVVIQLPSPAPGNTPILQHPPAAAPPTFLLMENFSISEIFMFMRLVEMPDCVSPSVSAILSYN